MTELAYSSEYQTLLLAECLHNVQLCELVRDSVKPENFADKCLQWYFDTITQSNIHLTNITLKEELIKASKTKRINKDEVPRYLEIYKSVSKKPSPLESDHVKDSLVKFIKTQNARKAILDSMDLIANEQWEQVETKISEALATGIDVLSLGQDYVGDINNRLDRRLEAGEARKLSTGIPELDDVLFGGVKNKQVALIAGGTGSGKSLSLLWMARHALMLGKSVVYFTLEMPEDDIAERLDSMICRIRPQELRHHIDESKSKLSEFGNIYANGKLFIKEFPPDTVTVSGLETYLKQLQTQGITADLVIIDYLDLLKPHRIYNNMNQEMDAVVKAICGLAKKLDTRVWTATQLNRAGMVQENPDETSIAGAIDKLFSVDIAILMARNKEEQELEEMRLIISKNRNGYKGKQIKIDTDYGYMSFYRKNMVPEQEAT